MLNNYIVHKKITESINTILIKHGLGKITLEDVSFTEDIVHDLVKFKKKLSNRIIDSLWPSLSSKVVYHYTSKEAAEAIINSRKFRLYNIRKRVNESEIVSFCEAHSLKGYLEEENGEPYYITNLMKDIFYASFTDSDLKDEDEEYFWRTFATLDGVRLKFYIESKCVDFRKMIYGSKKGEPIALLNDLVKSIRRNHDREFILSGISRLCAFYLSHEYHNEKEYRILAKDFGNGALSIKNDGQNTFIEIPLNEVDQATGFCIRLLEVNTNEQLNLQNHYGFVISRRENVVSHE